MEHVSQLVATGMSRDDAEREVLVSALARGTRYAAAGEAAGVSERTVRRRMSEPAFAAEVAQRRTQYVNTVTGTLLAGADRAVAVLLNALDSGDSAEQLRAAQLTLGLVRRYHADSDIEARLTALEAEVNGSEVGG
jgi:hypothetical protein